MPMPATTMKMLTSMTAVVTRVRFPPAIAVRAPSGIQTSNSALSPTPQTSTRRLRPTRDLLDLLGAYGDCGTAEFVEAEWTTCGDLVGYQGYNYETVLIGEHCWFARMFGISQK